MSYAENTSVPVDRSQAEIKRTLSKYSATSFAFAENDQKAMIMFEMQQRRIRFLLPMPVKPKPNCTLVSLKKYDQQCRSKWRCLVLAIKAKLECVDSGITTLEQEFLAHIVLPGGQTVGEDVIPKIEVSYKGGEMPPLLGMR